MAGQGRAQGQVGTWPRPGTAGAAPWLVPLAGLAGPLAARLREWAAAEAAPGRLMPWLPVAFGAGIAVYFSAEREPVWWMAAALAGGRHRHRGCSFPPARRFPSRSAARRWRRGLPPPPSKPASSTTPCCATTAYGVAVSGFVDSREERERSDRIVLRVTGMEGARLSDRPERIRLTVRKGTAPAVGSFVALKARLNPPTSPLRPGGYDLARDLYFQGIGATGMVLGAIKPAAAAGSAGLAPAVHDRGRSRSATPSTAASARRYQGMPARSPRRSSPASAMR